MARLIIEQGSGRTVHQIENDAFFIGSDESCIVRLQSALAAPKHCQMAKIGSEWHLIDLKSPAGSAVNGEKVTEKVLASGDRIEVPGAVITFEDAPRQSATRRAVQPAGSSARRGSARARARRHIAGRQVGSPAPAASEDEPLVRRRLREKRGLPGWALGMIAGGGSLLVIFVGYMIIKSIGGGLVYEDLVRQARERMTKGDYAGARAALAQIPEDAQGQVRNWRRDLAAEIEARDGAERNIQLVQGAAKAWASILTLRQKIDGAKETKDDPSSARFFVVHRLERFLKRYPDSEHAAEVRRLIGIYEKLYNPADPYPSTWWDVAMILRFERPNYRFGYCYEVLMDWMAKNPDHENLGDAQRQRGRLVNDANGYFEWVYEKRIKGALSSGHVDSALKRLGDVLENVTGIPKVEDRVRKQIETIKQMNSPGS